MDEDDEFTHSILVNFRFWVHRVLVPILLCLGLLGNTITVMVLTRRRMRCSTNTYLSALAVADIINLIFGFLLSFVHYENIHDRKYELYWRFYGLTHWLCDAASATSAWLAVSFTVERYIAVCHPMKGKVLCTERRAKSVIVIVYIFCILTTASTTFEYQLTFDDICIKQCPLDKRNTSESNGSLTVGDVHNLTTNVEPTSATFNPRPHLGYVDLKGYDQYVQRQLKEILTNCTSHPHIILVPVYPEILNSTEHVEKTTRSMQNNVEEALRDVDVPANGTDDAKESVILFEELEAPINSTYCCEKNFTIDVENTEMGKNKTYTNFIYWYSALFFGIIPLLLIATFNCFLVRAVYLSQKTRRVMTNSQEGVTWTNEKKITIMLIGIVFAFLICTIPSSIHMIYYHFHNPTNRKELNVNLILGNICNFMLMLNAPFNFIIYCLLSNKFRTTFKKIFWERRRGKQIEAETILLSNCNKSKDSAKFNAYKYGLMKRMSSDYRTPRNLETHSLTSMPRSRSRMMRPIGKAKSCDLNV